MKNKLYAIFFALSLGLLLNGCDNSASSANDSVPAVKIIKVGTMGTYEPFSYHDKNGRITGFDLELLRLLEKYLVGVKFEFHAGPWDTLFPGLDTDTFQLIANQITSTPERLKKYLLTDNHYFSGGTNPIVRADDDRIKSMADLAGKRVGTTVGDAHTSALEDYNKAHGNKINIVYYESDSSAILQDIINGRVDATVNNPIMAARKAKSMGLNIKPVDDVLVQAPIFFIMKNDAQGKALKEQLDQALLEVKKDGSLAKLSLEWFGKDYTN